MKKHHGPWRWPDEETLDLFPGLVVHDGRVSGSITLGRSRLPIWAPQFKMVNAEEYGAPPELVEKSELFFRCLIEARGEFARLLLVLADAERCEWARGGVQSWWQTQRHRKRVSDQLKLCLQALETI